MKITINGNTLKVKIADTFISRFRGLMLQKQLKPGSGLIITKCNSVHMMFMRFAIDVVYLDKNFCIKKIVRNLKTWTGISFCLSAQSVLELSAGEADRLNLQIGQIIKYEK